jgi:hypothetical protein
VQLVAKFVESHMQPDGTWFHFVPEQQLEQVRAAYAVRIRDRASAAR